MPRSIAIAASAAAMLMVSLAAPALAVADITKLTGAATALKQLNVLTFGDLNSSQHIEGKAWIGGNASGGGNFVVGQGNGAQGGASSTFSTLTVGGALNGSANILNGSNGTSGKVSGAGNYGITAQGNVRTLSFGDTTTALTVRIGGNAATDINFGGTADVSVAGSLTSLAAGANSIVRLGSVGGAVSAGNGSRVSIKTGTVSSLSVGTGGTVKVAGSVGGLTVGSGTTSSIGGTLGNNGQSSVNINGATTYVGGQLQTQNLNGLNGGSLYSNAARWSGSGANPAPAEYHFSAGQTIAAPDAAATVDVAGQTATFANALAYLSYGLKSLTASKAITTITALSAADYGAGDYVVFSIADGAAFFGQNGDLKDLFANMPTSKTVVFNVGGSTITQAQGLNFNDIALNQNLIWNFADASVVSLGAFQGTVLAPKATVSNSNTIEGSVVANVFNQNGEVHLGTFAGPTGGLLAAIDVADPAAAAIPETGSWAMMVLGFGIVGGALRRPRRQGLVRAA